MYDKPSVAMARQEFVFTMDGLWRLVVRATPILEGGEDPDSNAVDAVLVSLPTDVRTALADEFRDTAEELLAAAKKAEEVARSPAEERTAITVSPKTSPLAGIFLDRIVRQTMRPKADDLVRRATIPIAVGAFEVLLGAIATATFDRYPGLLGDEKQFSLGDLSGFSSVDEARYYLIDKRVDGLLASGVTGWIEWLAKDPLKIQLEKLTPQWGNILEVFQRRHLIVHTGGRVSKRYLSALDGQLPDLPALGTVLHNDITYVSEAIDRILVLGELLWAFAARSLGSPLGAVCSTLRSDVDNLLHDGRWFGGYAIAGMAADFRKDQSAASQVQFRLARLFAQRRLGMDAEVDKEAREFDVSALSHELRAQYYVITGDIPGAIAALRAAVRAGDTTSHLAKLSAIFADLDLTSLDEGDNLETPTDPKDPPSGDADDRR